MNTNGKYISEPHTDFIFCIVGEELGFIGTAAIILFIVLNVVLGCNSKPIIMMIEEGLRNFM